jgi:hypothetical protein
MRTLLGAVCLIGILLNMPASAQRVSPTAPMPNRTIAAPSSQRPGAGHPESTVGTIEGFVYWDANHFSHVPAGSCSGLAVTVAVGSSSGGPLVAYTPLATLTNNFKYVGQVKESLVGGKVNVYDVCTYGYDHVPVGPDLQVKLAVTQLGVFSPVAVPQIAILGPIKIINAQCNMLPRITNPTVPNLFAHWGSCQNMAYDVNFVMHTASRAQFSADGGGTITPAGSDTQRGMLSNSSQQGMLAGAGSPTQSQPAQNTCRIVGATQGKADARSSPAADWQMYSHFLEECISTSAEKLSPGKYNVSPASPLQPGEYAIVLRPVSKEKKFSGGDVARVQGDGLMFDAIWTFQISDEAE